MTNQYADSSSLNQVIALLRADLQDTNAIEKILGTREFSLAISATDQSESSFDCRIELQSPGAILSEEDAQALAEFAESRFEEIAVQLLGEDQGENLALDLMLVEVWLNGTELT
jgi:hypothetical protein